MWTSLGGGVGRPSYPRGQEGLSEEVILKLKTQHKSDMRRGEDLAFSVGEAARAKSLRRREHLSPSPGGNPSVVERRGRQDAVQQTEGQVCGPCGLC